MFAETATTSAGPAVMVPENLEPSDIDTDKAATVVPATELSISDAVVGVNVIPVGVGGEESAAVTRIVKVAVALNWVLIPLACTRNE